MARRRHISTPRVEQGTGRVLTATAKPKPKPTPEFQPRKAIPVGTHAPGTIVYPTPVEFPGLVNAVPTASYTPGQRVTQPGTDQYGNPNLPGSAGDRQIGSTVTTKGVTRTTQTQPTTDHSSQLGLYGIPPDVSAAVDNIFRQYPTDPSAAAQAAIAYVRGTDWYKQAFIGIDTARANGFIGTDLGSEQQYKQYVNSYQSLYQQYYGRQATPAELANLFAGAVQPDYLAKEFAGSAYWQANKADLNYLEGAFAEGGQGKSGTLSEAQGTTLGYQNAGIDTRAGQVLQNAITRAQQRLQTVFSGSLATPNLTLGPAGVAAPSLQGGKTTPDVAA